MIFPLNRIVSGAGADCCALLSIEAPMMPAARSKYIDRFMVGSPLRSRDSQTAVIIRKGPGVSDVRPGVSDVRLGASARRRAGRLRRRRCDTPMLHGLLVPVT